MVDASRASNEGRFVNDPLGAPNDEPNCRFTWMWCDALKQPILFVIALRDIRQGEELLAEYDTYWQHALPQMLTDHAKYLCFGVARVRQLEARLRNRGVAVPPMRALTVAGPSGGNDGAVRAYEPHLYPRDLIDTVVELGAYHLEVECVLNDRVDESGARHYFVSFAALDASWDRWVPASAIDEAKLAAYHEQRKPVNVKELEADKAPKSRWQRRWQLQEDQQEAAQQQHHRQPPPPPQQPQRTKKPSPRKQMQPPRHARAPARQRGAPKQAAAPSPPLPPGSAQQKVPEHVDQQQRQQQQLKHQQLLVELQVRRERQQQLKQQLERERQLQIAQQQQQHQFQPDPVAAGDVEEKEVIEVLLHEEDEQQQRAAPPSEVGRAKRESDCEGTLCGPQYKVARTAAMRDSDGLERRLLAWETELADIAGALTSLM